jgi:hypothetical protein
MAKRVMLPLTMHQAMFLWRVMQDYIDVTADKSVRRDATNIQRNLAPLLRTMDRGNA